MEGKGNNNKINNNSNTNQQQLNDQQNNHLNINNDEEFRWKEIDEMLSAFQRNSFFKPNNENPSPPAIIKNDLTNSLINSSINSSNKLINFNQNKIINWLKIEVELEEELAFKIGQLLINNGFDCFEFLKGSLNTKFMTELGIERKTQLLICRCLDEPTAQIICIPSALMFDSISNWLKALNLSELLFNFSKENISSIKDLINFKLNRSDLEKIGITKLGHIARIIKSIDIAVNIPSTFDSCKERINNKSSTSSPADNRINNLELNATTASTSSNNSIISSRGISLSPPQGLDLTTLRAKLRKGCVRFSAHYLGSVELSNNSDGSDECRQTMHSIKSKANQVSGVPQVLLDISISGINILDCQTQTAIHRHSINQIQIVCQDDLDLNFFSYIFKDEKQNNYCHCLCVLTSLIAKEIITTLGEAFNLAYKMALQQNITNI
uniref:SAM domain-containing protein n=1 Tax=Meloidogyne hapla TaxID=6305 RepID=A0A1I8B0B8_MELHA